MKLIYLAPLLSLILITTSSSFNLSDELNNIAKSAYVEIDKQMATQINLSGKQRMLSQKMTKEILFIALDIDTKNNLKALQKSINLFEKTLIGLKKGNKSLGLIATDDVDIIKQLEVVDQLWRTFKPHAQSTTSASLNTIASSNLPLLKAMDKVVVMYSLRSANELKTLANVINLAGKQRMLTQKMTKELLLIHNKIDVSANQKHLHNTLLLFEQTLNGLIKGDKTLDLPATTHPDIIQQLQLVEATWQKLKPLMTPNQSALPVIAKLNLSLLDEMNKTVEMFKQAAQ